MYILINCLACLFRNPGSLYTSDMVWDRRS